MVRYFGRGLGTPQMLEAIFRNNLRAAQSIPPQAIVFLVSKCTDIVRTKGSVGGRRFLAFLECLVTVNRSPVPCEPRASNHDCA